VHSLWILCVKSNNVFGWSEHLCAVSVHDVFSTKLGA